MPHMPYPQKYNKMEVLVMKIMKLLLIYSVFNTLFIFCCSSSVNVNQHFTARMEGNETDRLALLDIRAKIQHDPNQVMTSWNDSTHFCLWHGVTCSRLHHQRVTKLNMSSQDLAGSISPHIGNLSFLREIYLHDNSFTHEIPPEIGRLRRLQVLSLGNNTFTGPISANISNCFTLNYIHFGRNNLVGAIPSELGLLSKLQRLILRGNHLSGEIPPSIGNLSSLTQLGLYSNNLVGSIPDSLGQLKKLTWLALGVNMLSGIIPPSIYNLSCIDTFSVIINQLEGKIPSDLHDAFPHLLLFHISTNKFTGSIPSSICNATNLESLDFSENNLTGQVPSLLKLHNLNYFSIEINHLGTGKQGDLTFISELTNATQLRVLDLGYNNFAGILPPTLSNLSATHLTELWIQANQLRGSIPAGLGNLRKLQALAMQKNSLTSSIPSDIGKLSRLEGLYLDNNELSGSIPSSLENLTMLSILYLQGNNLIGNIPSSLGKFKRLQQLDLSQNNLDDEIPQQLLVSLLSSTTLNLSRNHFTGSLPVEIGKLKSLGTLDVSDNMLSGELPGSISSCESLEVLHLQGNFFQGHIPSSLKDLKGIRDLDISRNKFSGEIPKFLEDFVFLKNLNVSFNELSGTVPMEGVFNNGRAISVVGNSNLCGGISLLQLPTCNYKESEAAGRLSRTMKIIISLVSGFALLGIAVVLYFSFFGSVGDKRNESTIQDNNPGNSMLHVSYSALVKATDGFSSTNLIGMGAFGSVYKGVLEDDRVVVAVKVLNMLHRGASKSFMAECEALRNIRHRNLVKIITACSSVDLFGNDFKALVYEFMAKGSLDEWLHPFTGSEQETKAPEVLNLVQRLDIAIDVACALDYLHNYCEKPIVHCDLKPSNVLLDKELTGHVSDFGMARFLSNLTDGNQSSSIGIRGSVGYTAPEYGMGSEVSTNGDIYSFGILLLEMFTGKRPTDHMFNDGLNLHSFVMKALPEGVTQIADSVVLKGSITSTVNKAQNVKECLTLIFGIGIACSVASPINRKGISEAAAELQSIRDNLLS